MEDTEKDTEVDTDTGDTAKGFCLEGLGNDSGIYLEALGKCFR